eukprot:TRINITY_DN76015_c0_g1_i1.p1 TRINITY_DN76015_c0_g1~~TRINITY_DN76015_c0_g1_i1.p1  ORF type:complete len:581 (-),score=85.64 TRINITY_DN76015_c0_g1_i1:239-1945(-)
MACFNADLTESLCCGCNFPGCWSEGYSPLACCEPSSWAFQQHELSRVRNSSWVEAQFLLCNAKEVNRCAAREAFLADPVCQAMVQYVESLPKECINEISVTSCLKGIVLLHSNMQNFASALGKPRHLVPDNDLKQCSHALMQLRSEYRRLTVAGEHRTPAPPWPMYWETNYVAMLQRCARARKRELRRLMPRAVQAFSEDALKETRVWVGKRPRIGIILAMTPKEAKFYGHTLGIWRCYCAHHRDCEVVVEWDNFLQVQDYPSNWAVDYWTGDFASKVGFTWNRWFALQRHLDAYEWVFTADPDQFISHQCFASYSLSDALREAGALGKGDADTPVIVMRDFPDFHTLNSAGVFMRGGEAARLFLEMLISRMHWKGFADFDQSSFDQTVLEFLDLWRNARDHPSDVGSRTRLQFGSVECLAKQFAWLDGSNVLEMYNACWHRYVKSFFGHYGERNNATGAPVYLLSPQSVDLNYVVGLRDTDDDPLVWHLAGRHKFVQDEHGEVYMDTLLKRFWHLDPDPNVSVPRSPEPLPAGQEPECSFWTAAAGQGDCFPGTKATDCRQDWLAMC